MPSAFWGLGGEHQIAFEHQNLIALVLSVLAIVGALRFLRSREWGIVVAAAGLAGAAILFVVGQSYAYAAYKLISFDWWILAGLLVAGAECLPALFPKARQQRLAKACMLVVGGTLVVVSNHGHTKTMLQYVDSRYRDYTLADFAQVADVGRITGGSPVVVAVDDWLASEWAAYYLRDAPIKLVTYRMYLAAPGVQPSLAQSKPVALDQARYLLTDSSFDATSSGWQRQWSSGPYQLWSAPDSAWVVSTLANNPNGVEKMGTP
jgi:hypothetical protein